MLTLDYSTQTFIYHLYRWWGRIWGYKNLIKACPKEFLYDMRTWKYYFCVDSLHPIIPSLLTLHMPLVSLLVHILPQLLKHFFGVGSSFYKKCLQSWHLRFGHLYVTTNSDKNSETFKRIFYETRSIYSSWSGVVHYAEVEMGRWDLIGILNFQEKSLTIDHLKGKCHVQFLIQWVLLKSLRLK